DFAKVVGSLYYNKHDNTNIAMKRITYLLEYIRVNFYEPTSVINKEFMERICEKTGCDAIFIQELFTTINKIKKNIDQEWMSDTDLLKVNRLIEKFYYAIENG
ncbi:MAG: hypothetical protein LBD45_06590, partial [Bacteroidales bacterium]|nr:hypothetical protein [Bacteroidales bacterium]